jgi:hypothetical protein
MAWKTIWVDQLSDHRDRAPNCPERQREIAVTAGMNGFNRAAAIIAKKANYPSISETSTMLFYLTSNA